MKYYSGEKPLVNLVVFKIESSDLIFDLLLLMFNITLVINMSII